MIIKQLTITSHPPNTTEAYKKSETWFDIKGNKIEYREYKSGKIEVWDKLTFDDRNRMIERVKFSGSSYDLSKYKSTSYAFSFDADGYLILGKNQTHEMTEDGQRIIKSYYLNGSIKNQRRYSQVNVCIEDVDYEKQNITRRELYNNKGQLLEIRNFRSDGYPQKYTINTYNDQSQLVGVKSISKRRTQISDKEGGRAGDEYVSEDRILKYNDDGLLVEDIDYPVDSGSTFADVLNTYNGYSHKYSYDKDKRRETDSLYLCGELVMVYKYTYDYW